MKFADAIVPRGRAGEPLAEPKLAPAIEAPLEATRPNNSRKWQWRELVRASDCPLTATQRNVALAMAEMMDDRLLCFLSVRSIAARANCSRRTVFRALKAIVAAGYLQSAGTHSEYGTRQYTLAFPAQDGVTPCHPPGDIHAAKGDIDAARGDSVSPEVELPEKELEEHQSRTVAALVGRSLESAGARAPAATAFDTSTPALTDQPTAAPLTAEQSAALDRLLARAQLQAHQTDENSRTTFERRAAELSPHQLDQAGDELEAALANGCPVGVPVRNRTNFLYKILRRMCDDNDDRRRRTREVAA